MKRLCLSVLVVLATFAVCVPGANARRSYYLPYYRVVNLDKRDVKRQCNELSGCEYWGHVCRRVNRKRINCLQSLWFPPEAPEYENEYLRCDTNAKWGIGPGGYIKKRYGRPHCEYVLE